MHRGIALVLCVSLAACTSSIRESARAHEPTGQPMQRIRVLTYNTLHGLETSGIAVRPGESQEARQARLDVQFRALALVQPDVILLQEVNPLPGMANAYVAALARSGLRYAEVHQVDACGLRITPALAVVPGLNNGLVVLARAPLVLRKVKGLKLSGGPGGCDDFLGLQLNELRYALIAEIENPDTGRRVLVVNTHLHSGLERDAFFLGKIAEAEERGAVQPEEIRALVAALEDGQRRRLGEVKALTDEVLRLKAERRSFGVLLGGDLNFEPGSPEYRELERVGLRDTDAIASGRTDLHSYDPQQNVRAARGGDVPAALPKAVAHLPESQRERILAAYREGVSQPRRIDFLFVMRDARDGAQGCLRQELFGRSETVADEPGSDHYGVLVTYVTDPGAC